MLAFLHIHNLALIENIELEFADGINVLTGETGAGKSFILKALGFALGERHGAEIIRPGAEKARVEAQFILDEKEIILRREISAATGRSRFYINDVLSSQEVLKEFKAKLVVFTSQHTQQKLLSQGWQAQMFENLLNCPALEQERDGMAEKLKNTAKEIETLQEKQKNIAERRDILEMQLAEIEKIKPKKGEEEALEKIRAEARKNAESAKSYAKIMELLHGNDDNGLICNVKSLLRLLGQISNSSLGSAGFDEECETVAGFQQFLYSLSGSLPKPGALHNMCNMDELEERLFSFAQLKRKFKCSYEELVNLAEEIADKLSFLDSSNLDIMNLKRKKNALAADLQAVLEKIKPVRKKACENFANKLTAELKELGFSEHLKIIPEFTAYKIFDDILDERCRILWAPNPGQLPQSLDQIASGGELSRFLLGITLVNRQNDQTTFIFDEVDAGVGGLTLNKIGEKLQKLASANQIILITHWPMLAAIAKRHFFVSKYVQNDQTYTKCALLDEKEIKKELARMSGKDSKTHF